MPAPSTIGLKTCARLVDAAAQSCTQAAPPPKAVPTPNFDAMAAALTAQSNAVAQQALWLTALGVILGVVALFGGIAWARHVKSSAQEAAREAAEEEIRKIAPDIMNNWLSTEGIAQWRQAAQMAQPTTTDGDVANDIAANAGDE